MIIIISVILVDFFSLEEPLDRSLLVYIFNIIYIASDYNYYILFFLDLLAER